MIQTTGLKPGGNVPLPKAIMLDLDDTIISYDQGIDTEQCWATALRQHLPEEYAVHAEEIRAAIRQKSKWYWSDPDRHRIGRLDLYKARMGILAEVLPVWGIEDPSVASKMAITYGEERTRPVSLFPDSLHAIETFRSKGIKLAMITNGNADFQWSKIRRFHLAELFDCILVEGEAGIGKPEPEIYRLALERLGVAAEEAWMVGDNYAWEVEAPQRLGIKGIWIDHKGAGIPANASAKPYMIIKSLGDLLSVL